MTLINWLLILVALILLLYVTKIGTLIRKSVIFYLVIMFPYRKFHLPSWLSPKIKIIDYKVNFGKRVVAPKVFQLDDGKKHPGMVVFTPLAQEEASEIQAISFLKGLAKLGFTVMVPLWPNRPIGIIHDTDPQDLADSINWFSNQEFIENSPLGLVAVSYGAGTALIAAADDEIKKKIKYMVLISGYVDLLSTTETVVTGQFSYGKIKGVVEPDPYARYILFYNVGRWCTDKCDQEIFNEIGEMILHKDDINEKIKHLEDKLSPEGKIIFSWVTATDPKDFREKFKKLPARIKKHYDALTPKLKSVFSIKSPLLIMHSTNDRLIPHTESIKLFDHIKNRNKKSSLVLVSAFDHTIPAQVNFKNLWTVYIPNFFRIIRFIYQMLWLQMH